MAQYSKVSQILQMPVEVFRQCIDKLPSDVTIVFSGFSEAFLHPNCMEMIRYARDRQHPIDIFTTGVGMTESIIRELEEIPFRQFCLHLPDHMELTAIPVDADHLQILERLITSRISNLYCMSLASSRGKQILHPEVFNFVEKHGVDVLLQEESSRAGNLREEGRKNYPLRRCERMKANTLLPNGDVVLCCMDWGLKHPLGNLIEQSYESLFSGDEFLKINKGLRDRSVDILCRSCDWAKKRPWKKKRALKQLKRNVSKPWKKLCRLFRRLEDSVGLRRVERK